MKVKITETREMIVDIDDTGKKDIENEVLKIYNNSKETDWNIGASSMHYQVLPKTLLELGVEYDLLEFATYIAHQSSLKYSACTCAQLCYIIYGLFERYYRKGRRLFVDDFIVGTVGPKSLTLYDIYLTATTPVYVHPKHQKIIKITDIELLKDIHSEIKKVLSVVNPFDLVDLYRGSLYTSMYYADKKGERIIFS